MRGLPGASHQREEDAFMGKSYDYDVVVIGGGPGGYAAAIRASQLGARAACVEKEHLGGVCTNVGCIPTKVLAHAARFMREARRAGELGVRLGGVELDYPLLVDCREAVTKKLRGGIEFLLGSNQVEVIRGAAAFEDAHTIAVDGGGGSERVSVIAEKVMIATGSMPMELPVAPFDEDAIISSRGALGLRELPGSLIIVGGGYIGCEFASIFSAFGVDLTIVELKDRLLPEMDADCSREVTRELKKAGAKILTGTTLEGIEKQDGGVVASLSGGKLVQAEKALICVGRRPMWEGLDIEGIGIKTGGRGEIVVNGHMQTSVPHIYAIGDVAGGILLAHVASHEGLAAAAHATGNISAEVSYRVVPACAFTFPQIGVVGMTEEQAREAVGEVTVKKFPMRALGMAHVSDMTEGFVKLVCDGNSGEVLGVQIASAEASNLIAEAALAMQLEMTAEELAETIHAHPTMPESMREAAEGILGMPIDWMG